MISILKDGKVIRHVECNIEDADIQCLEGESWVEGELEFEPYVFLKTTEMMLEELNYDFQLQVLSLTEGSSPSEQATWTKQEQEARAWLADNAVSTPLIDAMVNARGCTKEYLVGKIIEKADLYAAEVGRLLGEKQRLEKELIEQYKEEI